MQTGSFFRLYCLLEADPDLERWDWNIVPEPAQLAEMVNRWETEADHAWNQLSGDQFLQIAYEDIMSNGARELVQLAEFLLERPTNERDHEWAQAEAAGLRPAPLRRIQLDADARRSLERACEPSRRLLGYV